MNAQPQQAEPYAAATYYHRQMTVAEWIAVPDNPHQRDTERHFKRSKHLRKLQRKHLHVEAAQIRSTGQLYKVDAHTRAWAWEHGKLERPNQPLDVLVHVVNDIEEVKLLYHHCDSAEAVETAADQVAGAYRGAGFAPKSACLKAARLKTPIGFCYAALKGNATTGFFHKQGDIYAAISEFKPELMKLDEIIQGKPRTEVIATNVLTVRKYDEKTLNGFWEAFFANKGEKRDGKMDGVQALHELIAKRFVGGTGGTIFEEHVSRAVNAVEFYIAGEWLRGIPKKFDLRGYLSPRGGGYLAMNDDDFLSKLTTGDTA